MDFVQIVFITMLAFSIVSIFLSIPGNFIVFLNTLLYGIFTNFDNLPFSFILIIFIIAVLIELLEYLIIAFGARKYGTSRFGVVGAIIGGIGGSISGFFFSPVAGAIIGGFIGVMVGTMAIELLRGKQIREVLYATYGAILGRVGGLSVKAIGTVTLVVIVANKIFF
jgi:uncharacterized protein YqgC (DUF456 family)